MDDTTTGNTVAQAPTLATLEDRWAGAPVTEPIPTNGWINLKDVPKISEVDDRLQKLEAAQRALPGPEGATIDWFEPNDEWNAKELVARFGPNGADDIKFCSTLGTWMVWKGKAWIRDNAAIHTCAKQTRASILTTARQRQDKAKISWATRMGDKKRLDAMVYLAEQDERLRVTAAELDADPWLFNCQNGTLDLRTGKLIDHNKGHLLTKISPALYDARAECPRWKQFLQEVFAGDENVIRYVQKALGIALTGETDKVLFWLLGNQNNGKTTLLNVFRDSVVGEDYGAVMDIKNLTERPNGNDQNYALARLLGKRMVTCSEPKQGDKLDVAKVKEITGLGKIQVRAAYGMPFEYRPQFTLFVDANHRIAIPEDEEAMWARLQPIPFSVIFPPEKQDKTLPARLAQEAPGILTWAVQGCLEWRKDGRRLNPPKTIAGALKDYRETQDLFADFLAEACVIDPDARATSSELWDHYLSWAKHAGHWAFGQPTKPLSNQTAFGLRLGKDGRFTKADTKHDRGWRGLRLNTHIRWG